DAASDRLEQVITTFGQLPVVFIPQGRFALTEPLVITKPVVLVGRGLTATVLKGLFDGPVIHFQFDKSGSEIPFLDSVNAPGARHLSVVGTSSASDTNNIG